MAAIRAAQLGKRVTLIEKDRVGGTCMNWGCIPTKFLLHETGCFVAVRQSRFLKDPLPEVRCDWTAVQKEKQARVDRLIQGIEFLLKKNGVALIQGSAALKEARLLEVQGSGGDSFLLEAENVILATGGRPAHLPFLVPDGERILTSREALELKEIPRSILIVGAGAIGLEMGTIYHRLGSRVTILEIMPQILPHVLKRGGWMAGFYGGTSILIMVGVALDLVEKIESHLMMRHYEGFMRKGKIRGRR